MKELISKLILELKELLLEEGDLSLDPSSTYSGNTGMAEILFTNHSRGQDSGIS